MEMCNETMVNTIIVTYMIFQVLVGYQCYNARNFMRNKQIQEESEEAERKTEEAKLNALKKGDIVKIKEELYNL